MRSTFIGGGNMASAMIGGLLARGAAARDIRVVEPFPAQRERLAARFPGVDVHPAIAAATRSIGSRRHAPTQRNFE